MTEQQLTEYVRELAGLIDVQRRELAELQQRVADLESAKRARYRIDQEVSAHLNGMTYP